MDHLFPGIHGKHTTVVYSNLREQDEGLTQPFSVLISTRAMNQFSCMDTSLGVANMSSDNR